MNSTLNDMTNCPLCPHHCPIDSPSCERGQSLVEKLKAGENVDIESLRKERGHGEHGHGEHGERGRGEHGHGEHKRDRESLEGLLRECGHALHHRDGSDTAMFGALSAEEQDALKSLLKKLVESWD